MISLQLLGEWHCANIKMEYYQKFAVTSKIFGSEKSVGQHIIWKKSKRTASLRALHIPVQCRLRTGSRCAVLDNCIQSAVHSEQSKTAPTAHINPAFDRLYKESGKMRILASFQVPIIIFAPDRNLLKQESDMLADSHAITAANSAALMLQPEQVSGRYLRST